MNALFPSLILAVVFIPAALSLKCYVCESSGSGSWSNCDDARTEVTCPAGLNTCAKIYMSTKIGDTKVETYGRSCFVKSACDTTCKGVSKDITKCEINCCDKDLCNAGGRFETSKPLVMLCVLLVSITKLFG